MSLATLAPIDAPTARQPLPAFRLGHPETTPALPFGDDGARLIEEFEPRTLAEVVGQSLAIMHLSDYAAAPYPYAFLFAGSTGVGKSSAARALARELGADDAASLWQFDASALTGDRLESLINDFRFAPMFGWRCVIVEEADYIAGCPKASHLWLSILQNPPVRTTIVFTTNKPEKFERRFLRRMEMIRFADDPIVAMPDAAGLVARIWREKTGRDDAPTLDQLGYRLDRPASFGEVVQALEPFVRDAAKRSATMVRKPIPATTPALPIEPPVAQPRPVVPAGIGPEDVTETRPTPEPAPVFEPRPPAPKKARPARVDVSSLVLTSPDNPSGPAPLPTVGDFDDDGGAGLLADLPTMMLRQIAVGLEDRYEALGLECLRVEAWMAGVRREMRTRSGNSAKMPRKRKREDG